MKLHLYSLLLLAGASVQASTFVDHTFNNADWNSSILTNTNNTPASTYAAYQVNSGGNTGAYRYSENTTYRDGSGLYNTIRISNLYNIFSIDPGLAPIQSIDFSFDLIYYPNQVNSFNGSGYALEVIQQGKTYLSPGVASDTPYWNTHSFSGLTEASFCEGSNVNALDCSPTGHPNFGNTGTTIQFGYAAYNGIPNAAYYGTQKSGLDNFDVTINSAVPEPGSLGLAAIGLALTGWGHWHRRKSRLSERSAPSTSAAS